MSLNKENKISDYSEKEIIELISSSNNNNDYVVKGIGDDCAVCKFSNDDYDHVYTSDATIEGIHFKNSDDCELIGSKAVGRVLSDLASMGSKPVSILVNIVISENYSVNNLQRIYSGIYSLLNSFNVSLIGGDLTSGKNLSLHIFGIGILPKGSAIYRCGAKIGDMIWSTGKLGKSFLGKHLSFTPRVYEGIWLRESGFVNSMIDISDGLATDLRYLIEPSNLGAFLYKDNLNIMSSVNNVLYDGEDYELLFTTSRKYSLDLQNKWNKSFDTKLWNIGEITDKSNCLYLKSSDQLTLITKDGYQHF